MLVVCGCILCPWTSRLNRSAKPQQIFADFGFKIRFASSLVSGNCRVRLIDVVATISTAPSGLQPHSAERTLIIFLSKVTDLSEFTR